jgi:protein-S-isoprenylcysteine O-methyltransferase Ste14
MRAVELVFAVGWAAFWMYWLVAAFSMKRGRVPWSRELRIRAVIVVMVILLVRLGVFRDHGLNTDSWRASLGVVLFALGLGFAIWARVHMGRNWGIPMRPSARVRVTSRKVETDKSPMSVSRQVSAVTPAAVC